MASSPPAPKKPSFLHRLSSISLLLLTKSTSTPSTPTASTILYPHLSLLSSYDTTIFIDDSYSKLGPHLNGTLTLLKTLLPPLLHFQPEGLTLDFLSFRKMPYENVTSEAELTEILTSVKLRCRNEMVPGEALKHCLENYPVEIQEDYDQLLSPMPAYSQAATGFQERRGGKKKGVLIIILLHSTPGNCSIYDRILESVARRLEDMKAEQGQVVLQFVQIGDHQRTTKWLEGREKMATSKGLRMVGVLKTEQVKQGCVNVLNGKLRKKKGKERKWMGDEVLRRCVHTAERARRSNIHGEARGR